MATKPRDVERQTVSLPVAFRMLGVSRPTGYAIVQRGEFPVPVIRVGGRSVVSKRVLDALLDAPSSDVATAPGLEADDAA